ncbi:hypothetical protein QQY66_46025 [Streptomyces sp. DG2A-72]|uniref:hypothetical protein n=1 Tax=Streptomyces sp. DG2A-72 TaxID=3051386 RepID=UPI00265C65E4|nr:hypothetical protein [Streptomyces sp. DG2A-72]MDO0938721.1 hypothetical protein [Streptomyces sp. DG2A-72]
MTPQQRYPDPIRVELPVGFEAWLLDCVPVPGCKICKANKYIERRWSSSGRLVDFCATLPVQTP